MKKEHVSPDQMIRYVNGTLAEAERVQVEQQMTACDCCLKQFVAAVESSEDVVESVFPSHVNEPQLPDMEQLEQRVVAQLLSEERIHQAQADGLRTSGALQKKFPRLRAWLQHPVTHYTIAASITLLLLVTGTFASFSQKLAQLDMNENVQQAVPPYPPMAAGKHSESWSDKIVDQTGSWLDGLRAARYK